MLQHRPSQASSSSKKKKRKKGEWDGRKKNQITWPSIIINSWWNGQSWTLSLPLLSSMHSSLIVDWLFMQIFLTSLVLFFLSSSFLSRLPCCLTNKHIPEKLNVVHVIYVIGQSIDIYFISSCAWLSYFFLFFCVCHLSSSFCTFALPIRYQQSDGDWMKNQKELLACLLAGVLVSIFIHYENRVIKMQHRDSFYARNADLCSEAIRRSFLCWWWCKNAREDFPLHIKI